MTVWSAGPPGSATEALALEPAGADDLDALAALQRACAPHPWSRDQLRAALADRATSVAVLRERAAGGAPHRGLRGFCVTVRAGDEVEVHDLAVAPEHRRRGHARRLLAHALEAAARAGARRAFLEVREGNAAARALYRALDFVEAGRRRGYYSDPDEDALVLRRNLEIPEGAC